MSAPDPIPQPAGGLRWEILRLGGVPFFIEPGFLLFAGLIFAMSLESRSDLSYATLIVFIIFFSLMIHEGGHALACRLCGLWPVTVRLVMFGGQTHHPPTTRGRNLLVSLAGPLGTFLIIAGTYIALQRMSTATPLNRGYEIIRTALALNVFWLVFNLLPILPLDGGQALLHGLSFLLRPERALGTVAVISILCAAGGAACAWFYFNNTFMLVFMIMFAYQNWQILQVLRAKN